MNFLSTYFLAAELPEKIAGTSHEWIPLYGALLITVGTAFVNIWRNRSKTKHDQFQVFMNESSEFREEMRKEKEILKAEVVAGQAERKLLQERIASYEESIESCEIEKRKYILQLEEARKENDSINLRLSSLKERVVALDASANGKV